MSKSRLGASASRRRSWATIALPPASSSSPERNTTRSRSRREYTSSGRSSGVAVPIAPGEGLRMSIREPPAVQWQPVGCRQRYDGSRRSATRRLHRSMEQEPVTRSIRLDATLPDVWRALTEASLLSDWFEADVELDAR